MRRSNRWSRWPANLFQETKTNQNESLRLAPLQRSTSNDVTRSVMWFTFGLAGVVLLIACANLANLQLVRSAARTREHSLRAALGAKRFRLLRQSMTESLVLSCLGGALSLLFAYGGDRVHQPESLRIAAGCRRHARLPRLRLRLRLFRGDRGRVRNRSGVARITRQRQSGAQREPARGDDQLTPSPAPRPDRRRGRVRRHSAGRSGTVPARICNASRISTHGWRADGLLTGQLGLLRGERYAAPAATTALLSAAGATSPRNTRSPTRRAVELAAGVQFQFKRQRLHRRSTRSGAGQGTGGVFRADQPRLLRHVRRPSDCRAACSHRPTCSVSRHVAIINQTMARQFWPNDSPLGKHIRRNDRVPIEVIGVVSDVSFPASLAEPYTRLQAFRPLAQGVTPFVNVTLRTSGDPEQFATSDASRARPNSIPRSRSTRFAAHETSSTRGSATSHCSARCSVRLPHSVWRLRRSGSTASRRTPSFNAPMSWAFAWRSARELATCSG